MNKIFRIIIDNIRLGLSSLDLLNNYLLFKIKKVEWEIFPKINGKLKIFRKGKIVFGKSVKINSGKNFNPIGGDLRTVFAVSENAVLIIGNNVGISYTTIVCRERIIIGDNVKIGGGTKIYDTDFHALDSSSRSRSETDIPKSKPIIIKQNAFIGAHSILLKGITVGKESIIGAGSVVTRSIPDGEIWGGNPVKFIRKI